MNEGVWNRLPKQDQDAIMSVSGKRASRVFGRAGDAADAVGIASFKAHNIATITASPQFVAEMKKRIQPIEDEWVKEAKTRGWDGARFLAELRAEVGRVASGK